MHVAGTATSHRAIAAYRVAVVRLDWILAVLAGLVSVTLAAHALGSASVWFDEAYAVELSKQPVWDIARYALGPNGNMVLYYLILHFWLTALRVGAIAPTEALVRLPSALFAGLSGVVVYALGLRFRGRVAGIVAVLLFAVNDLQLADAQQTRSYSLQVLFICMGWYALIAATTATDHRHARRWWLGYTVVMVAAVLAHFYSDLVLLAQWVAIAGLGTIPNPLHDSARRAWRTILKSSVVILALTTPLVLLGMVRGGSSAWITPVSVQDLVALFVTIGHSPLYLAALAVASIVALTSVGWTQRVGARAVAWAHAAGYQGEVSSQPGVQASTLNPWILVSWAVVPVALSFALTQPALNLHLFYSRYLVTIVPALCLLAGVGVALLRWRSLQVVAATLLVALAAAQAPSYFVNPEHQDFRSAAQWLAAHYAAGDGLACYSAMECVVPLQYYLDAYPSPAHFDANSPGNYNWTYVRYPNVLALSGSYVPVDERTMSTYAAQHRRIILAVSTINTTGTTINVQQLAQADPGLKAAVDWLQANETLQQSAQVGSVLFLVYAQR